MTRTFVLDLLERAGKTFAQAALAVLAVQWGASGLGVAPFDLDAWGKILTAAAAAGLAAVVSSATSLLSGLSTGTASAVPAVAKTAVLGNLNNGVQGELRVDDTADAVTAPELAAHVAEHVRAQD